jgi:hypothetical protein
MKNIRELEFKSLVDLLDYLVQLSASDIEEEKQTFIEERIWGFFPNLSFLQQLEFNAIIKDRDEKAFDQFKLNHPEVEVDETGRSTPTDKNFWEVKEKALDKLYQNAVEQISSEGRDTSNNRINTQVINAKTLSNLESVSPSLPGVYFYMRILFANKFKTALINYDSITSVEEKMKSLKLDPVPLMSRVMSYCEKKEYDEFSIFIEHLFRRIDLLNSDTKLESISNKEFLDVLCKITTGNSTNN